MTPFNYALQERNLLLKISLNYFKSNMAQAKDVTQTFLLKWFEKQPQAYSKNLKSFVVSSFYNHCRNSNREYKRYVPMPIINSVFNHNIYTQVNYNEQNFSKRDLQVILDKKKLGKKSTQVLNLMLEGYTHTDISKKLQMDYNTTKAHYVNLLKILNQVKTNKGELNV